MNYDCDFYSRNHRSDSVSQYSRSSCRDFESSRTHYEVHDCPINISKEKRTQKILVFMVTAYGVCLCPLMVLRLARLAMVETYENSAHLDITFIIFVWISFVPTCTTTVAFASWQMSRLGNII